VVPPDPCDIDAVVFDMGGVFIIPNPGPVCAAVAVAGVDLEMTVEQAHDAHYTGVRAITERLAEEDVDESRFEVWRHYDTAYFGSLGLAGVDLEVAIDARDELRRRDKVTDLWTQVLSHNIAGFADISEVRPVAIVTNNIGTAVQQCQEYGICQLGHGPLPTAAAIVDSTVVGIAKPDPRIFDPALVALGTERTRTLYVGDTVHADVRGATAAGMPVVQLDPLDLHADHDHWRLPDVAALADLFR